MSDLATYCKIYKDYDVLRMFGVGLTHAQYKTSCDAYKDLAFMIESNKFFEVHLIPHFDEWFGINIRLFDDTMYLNYSFTERTVDEIRQWKLGW